MHTGYDYNYWMYQNQRPEPVKIDSHPVYTDNYKQVRGMGGPYNSYNYVPPPNNIPKPRKKIPNDQQRVTNYQNMWPSSVHSLPFRSSQTQNYHSEEGFPVQPNNVYESAQPMQNCNFSQLQIPNNVSFPQVRNVNFKGVVNNQNNQNAKTPRIRVKDVSSLNNNFIGKNSVLDNCLLQHQKTKQRYNSFNSPAASQNTLYNNEAPREHVNFDRNTVPELTQSYHHYGPHGAPANFASNEQQYHISGSFYKQNAGYTNESHNQFNTIQQMEQMSETYNTSNYSHLPVQMANNKTVQPPAINNAQLLSTERLKGNEVATSQLTRNPVEPNASISSETNSYGNRDQSKSTTYTFSDMLDSSKISTVSQFQNQKQLALPAVPQCPLINPLSPPDSPVTQSAPHSVDEVNTSIPHSSENTVISFAKTNFAELKRNSTVCLYKGSTVGILRRNSLPLESHTNATNQPSSGSCRSNLTSPKAGYTSQTPGRSILNINSSQQQLEPVDNCETNGPNITNSVLLEHRIDRPTEEATSCPNQTKDRLAASEVTSAHSEKEDFENEVPVIKIEDDSFTSTTTEQLADQRSLRENQISSVGDEKIGSSQPESKVFLSENSECASKTSADLTKTKNCIQELETLPGNNELNASIENESQKTRREKLNLQSRINRNKLNMLINFLNEDGKSIEKQELHGKDLPAWVFSEKENNLKPNRRKISKTCVVRNKNNEREMISLVSPKTPNYFVKLSCNKTDNNSNELIEVNGFTESEIETSDSSESTVILEKPSEISQNPKESTGEGKLLNEVFVNCSFDKKMDTSEETKLINIMRAFKNLKAHFCANCDFISPVGSLWINVVSGELRCLNCFKKMICKTEENFKKSQKNLTHVSQADSTQKIEKGEKNENSEETNKKQLNSEVSLIGINSKLDYGEKNGESEVPLKEENVVTHTDEELKEKDTEELSNTLKISASEAEKPLQRRKSSEEKKTEKTAERLTKSHSSSLSSSKHDGSKNVLKRDRNSTEGKITEKEVKSFKRQASEEVVKAEVSKNKEEKSSKTNSAKEDESKKENRKRTNSTFLSHVPHKVQIVEDSAKENNKKEDDYYQKEREEYSKKAKKLIEIFNKRAKKTIPILRKIPEQNKPKEQESSNPPEKVTSKEDSTRRKSEERDVFKSLKKETKHEKTKIRDSEQKEQSSKNLYLKETTQGNKEEKNKLKSSQTHSHHHKLSDRRDSSSKALKEKSHSKAHSEGKHVEKETHKSHEHKKKHKEKKEGRKGEENPKKKIREEKADAEKKKGSTEKFDKSQKEKKSVRESELMKNKSDKAVECSFGEILKQMDAFPMSKNATNKKPNSDSLLAKLMKKTKKLSQTLLDDAQ